ncbi:acetyltransferase [Leptolyngbya sp. FACHB-671]|uniref:acetyltransferase n=1 Tax=Leptolyngbya sp. FACHB-671 TaxID=2692812 RepID=UPI001F5509BC|nr:acetyltransferase [Leptolyngbya sp. FACHB-671]
MGIYKEVLASLIAQEELGINIGTVMFLENKQTGDLVEVLDPEALFNPVKDSISAQVQAGQEEQEPASISKENLKFPSGEELPRCWVDADYRTN